MDCPVIAEKDFSKKDFDKYDNIIFGGCVQAGGIMGFDLIKKNMRRLEVKKIVTFSVGLNVMQKVTRIKGIDAGIMKMMISMLESKGALEMTEEEKKLLDAVKNGANYVDRKYIEPIVNEFK